MTILQALITEIQTEGPLTLARYMQQCNAHYYAQTMPFGVGGDFITAPDISQVFGELIGLWCADLWQRAGAPDPFVWAELGPGRGTLMQDAWRATQKVDGFHQAAHIHFIETSPALRALQKQRMPHAQWHDRLETLPKHTPRIVIANEFFDALPIEQHDAKGTVHTITTDGARLFWQHPRQHPIYEHSPARTMVMQAAAQSIAAWGGALLIIDYGDINGVGDTVQAVKGHQYVDMFAHPGEQDVTAHVDFKALADVARAAGCAVYGPLHQGNFLHHLGVQVRAAHLIQAHPHKMSDINTSVVRLIDPAQMGTLFKVMAVAAADWPHPAGLAAAGRIVCTV